MNKNHFDVLIIGAGAAGMMCALQAGKRGRSVALIEHNDRVGRKIRISGGGRCNFTNIHTTPNNYLSENPHFAKSALARYTPDNFINLLKKHKIKFHEKKLGQLFCDDTAQQVIDMLKKECEQNNVRIFLSTKVTDVTHDKLFYLKTNTGIFSCEHLVIATGGLSIPSLGATDFGYKIARQFKLKVNHIFPGLVPLTLIDKELHAFKKLSGLSLDVLISHKKISFRENILFTHRGLSGPAILQISSYWEKGQPLTINLLPDNNVHALLEEKHDSKTTLKNFLTQYFPNRFVDTFVDLYFNNKPLNQYSPKELKQIAEKIHRWQLHPHTTEGYLKAEVTVGGIDTKELSSKTFESKKVPGLFFIGEVVDVTGHLGGFNFQWAWASGFAAGEYV